jgi:hypothetical protein
MKDGYLRGVLSPRATQRQMEMLAAFVALVDLSQLPPHSPAFGRAP